jgi:DNA invertase Pin-like site-specific DNA recombinase
MCFASLAEFERNLIRERTLAGLRAARARGRNGGRPRKLKTKDIQAIKALMHAGELPVQDIADKFGVARSTLYRNAAGPESPKVLKTHAIQNAPVSKIQEAEMAKTSGDKTLEWTCLKSSSLRRQ